jgi:phage/plasmid-like protein (TIGR03299 family)
MDNITQNADGTAEFTASRQPAWHQLGETTSHRQSVEEGMRRAGLYGWNLRKEELVAALPEGLVKVKDQFATVRDVPGEGPRVLGVVGQRYQTVANEDWSGFVQALFETNGGENEGMFLDAAGSLDGGRVAFATLGFEGGTFGIGGHDMMKTYVTVLTSHDGSLTLTARPTTIRVVCANTVNAMLGEVSKQVFGVRHTAKAEGISNGVLLEEARAALKLTFTQREQIAAEAEKFLATAATDSDFDRIIRASFPDMTKALDGAAAGQITGRSVALAESRRADLYGLWAGPTVAGAGIGGTAWGAINAIGEYADWYSTVKGSGVYGEDVARARRDMIGGSPVDTVKGRAFKATKELLQVA